MRSDCVDSRAMLLPFSTLYVMWIISQKGIEMRLLKKLYVSFVAASSSTAINYTEHNFYVIDL